MSDAFTGDPKPVTIHSPKAVERIAAELDPPTRILVVEDEESVRRFTVQTLGNLGYIALAAETGQAAIDCWTQAERPIDVLLADIFLPDGTTGAELAHEFWKANPRLKVIFSSGFPYDKIGDDPLFKKASFLQKPYSADQLVNAVLHCFDAAKGS